MKLVSFPFRYKFKIIWYIFFNLKINNINVMSYQKDNKYTKQYHDLWSKGLCFNRSTRPNFLITIIGVLISYIYFLLKGWDIEMCSWKKQKIMIIKEHSWMGMYICSSCVLVVHYVNGHVKIHVIPFMKTSLDQKFKCYSMKIMHKVLIHLEENTHS